MRKGMTAALVALSLSLGVGLAATVGKFTDIANSPHKAAIEWGVHNELISGKTDTQFKPNDTLTRGQMMTILKKYHDKAIRGQLEEVNTVPSVVSGYGNGLVDLVIGRDGIYDVEVSFSSCRYVQFSTHRRPAGTYNNISFFATESPESDVIELKSGIYAIEIAGSNENCSWAIEAIYLRA